MTSPEDFDVVYTEAFKSATGEDLELPEYKHSYDAYIDMQSASLLEAWTSREERPDTALLSHTDNTENLLLTHPNQNEFTLDDIETISRVRFLGRKIIDVAKEQLSSNRRFMSFGNKSPESIYDFFQAYDWYQSHPNEQTEQLSEDPDVASPLRLGNWPSGEYANCLGVSIAMAASCELYGLPYVYGNEVRNSQSVIAEQHTDILQQAQHYMPTLNDGVFRDALLKVMHERREPDEKYDNILFETPDVLKVRPRVRDFHHFVVSEYKNDEDQNVWVQIDPYDLTFAGLSSVRRQIDKALEPFFETGNENTVVLSDEHRMIAAFYRRFAQTMHRAHALGSEVSRAAKSSDIYKSQNFVRILKDRSVDIMHDVMDELMQVDPSEESISKAHKNDEHLLEGLYVYTLYPLAKTIPAYNRVVLPLLKQDSKKVDWETLDAKVEKLVMDEATYNPRLRKQLVENLTALPLLCLLHIYEVNLRELLRIRDVGDACPVLEIGDPEFMIGAMYMNHYATWRKDGRINVARHLSRICSSQLLWQAARQDEEKVDERIVAMGQVIKNLKPRQLHPLVNIASGIPQPTTR